MQFLLCCTHRGDMGAASQNIACVGVLLQEELEEFKTTWDSGNTRLDVRRQLPKIQSSLAPIIESARSCGHPRCTRRAGNTSHFNCLASSSENGETLHRRRRGKFHLCPSVCEVANRRFVVRFPRRLDSSPSSTKSKEPTTSINYGLVENLRSSERLKF